jgi:hypothetical protein
VGSLVNVELERIWKEAVFAYCEVLAQQLCGETEEQHENLCGQPDSGPRFEAATSQFEAGALPNVILSTCSVCMLPGTVSSRIPAQARNSAQWQCSRGRAS